MDKRDTVRAMPVPSKNPLAAERAKARFAILRSAPGVFVGIEVDEGLAKITTPAMNAVDARRWLEETWAACESGSAFPSFCDRGHLRDSPSLCGVCLKGSR